MSADILPDDKFIVITESVQFGINIVIDIDKDDCSNQIVEIQGSNMLSSAYQEQQNQK